MIGLSQLLPRRLDETEALSKKFVADFLAEVRTFRKATCEENTCRGLRGRAGKDPWGYFSSNYPH